MTEDLTDLAERLRQQIQSRLHAGLEARAEAIPNGESVRVDVVVLAEAGSREPWSRHVLVADLRQGDEAITGMAKLLAERASREWLARQADEVDEVPN